MKKFFKIFFMVLLTLFITSGIVLYAYLKSFSNNGSKNSDSYVEPIEAKSGDPFNILLLGVDIGTVGSKNSPKRTDTMMVFHYNPKTSEVSIVSVPRDTRVTLRGKPDKINAANVYGGSSLAIKTVEDLLGIKINYYVKVNYEAFRKIIDAIGGIDVVVPYDMNYDAESQNLHIHFKKGQKVHLDGKKAEEFVRWRKNNDGTGYADGDLGRIRGQQEFILRIVEKMKSPSIVLKIPSIAKILPEYIETNMEPMTILNLSREIPKVDVDSIQKYTIDGEDRTIDGLSYFVYSPEKSMDIVAQLGSDIPLVISPADRTENKNIRVQVLNGSGVEGAASKAQKELEEKGYTVVGIGNISGVKLTSSYVLDKTLRGVNARQIASELGITSIKKDQDNLSKVDVLVILGLDKSSVVD